MTRLPLLAAVLFLTGCAGAPGWVKSGADAATTAGAYQECRDSAGIAVKTDADIDQDIAATRPNDLQRAGVFRGQTETAREMTRDRAEAIVAACMQAKGFIPTH